MTSRTEIVRPIGAIENLFAAYGDVGAMTFAMVAELAGVIDESSLVIAIAAVQAAHPLLQVRLGVDAEGHLALLRCDAPVLVHVRWSPKIDLEAEVADAIKEPFVFGVGPLMRVIAITDGASTALICVWHHAIADGKGALIVMNQLISALGGSYPTGSSESKPLDDFAGYASQPLRRGPIRPAKINKSISLTIEHLPAVTSRRLLLAAKCHGVSFNSLLVAIVAKAHRPGIGGSVPRIMSPVDLRPVLGTETHDGLFITIAVSSGQDGESIWEHARRVGEGTASVRDPKAIAGFVASIGNRFAMAADYDDMRLQFIQHSPFDTIVTNLGVIEPECQPGQLRLVRILGPMLKPFNQRDIITVSTFGGITTLTQSSANGDEGLLGRIISSLASIA